MTKKVKYDYQGLPHPENTASPRSQKGEEKSAWVYKMIVSNKIPQTFKTVNEKHDRYRLGSVSCKTI
jgi:hypothetical protein